MNRFFHCFVFCVHLFVCLLPTVFSHYFRHQCSYFCTNASFSTIFFLVLGREVERKTTRRSLYSFSYSVTFCNN